MFQLLLLSLVVFAASQPTAVLSNGVTVLGRWWQPSPSLQPVKAFLGVPFGTSERFQPPKEHIFQSSTFNASQYGAFCWGLPTATDPIPRTFSDDCLNLDIYIPITDGSAPLPVLVWIYGGSFNSGLSGYYDGSFLAQQRVGTRGMIVVAINYRLGPFGYLRTPILSGNLGFLDQQLALAWVKAEIFNFGGNPDAITVAGESAGAISVLSHLVSAESQQYFNQAIVQSGFPYAHPPSFGLGFGAKFSVAVGCDPADPEAQLKCLTDLPAQTLLASTPLVNWAMNIDGTIITEDPVISFRKGKFGPQKVLFGHCKDETSLFLCPQNPNGISPAQYVSYIENLLAAYYPQNYTTLAQALAQKFPPQQYSDTLQAFIDVSDLVTWFCPVTKAMQQVAYRNHLSNYQYVLSQKPGWWSSDCYQVAHASDLVFLFPLLIKALAPGYSLTATEEKLSLQMLQQWNDFVTYGSIPSWEYYDITLGWNYEDLSNRSSVKENFRLQDCEFWWQIAGLN